jgi:peptidoglycan/xylan/chitin deacetylase (PgdA/CDA1 family)
MLLILLYHRINAAEYSNSLDMFSAHLRYVSNRYPIVLPGDPLQSGKISVCLTFDDAYFDFYHYVFPLLSELKVRALLSVPVKYIVDSTTVDRNARLSVPSDEAMVTDVYTERVPFCTWDELSKMVASGFVEVASHSYGHRNITDNDADLKKEIVGSKALIEEKLSQKITTFVYPFGKANATTHSLVTEHYSYAMRIGSAFNKDWHNTRGLLYRVNGDGLTDPAQPFTRTRLSGYLFKYLMNIIRGR